MRYLLLLVLLIGCSSPKHSDTTEKSSIALEQLQELISEENSSTQQITQLITKLEQEEISKD